QPVIFRLQAINVSIQANYDTAIVSQDIFACSSLRPPEISLERESILGILSQNVFDILESYAWIMSRVNPCAQFTPSQKQVAILVLRERPVYFRMPFFFGIREEAERPEK